LKKKLDHWQWQVAHRGQQHQHCVCWLLSLHDTMWTLVNKLYKFTFMENVYLSLTAGFGNQRRHVGGK
jgi:hypothetical protein